MIINTGMRTDIPAFYHEWLINRIKEGFVLVRNPYNPSQVTRYSLSYEVVDDKHSVDWHITQFEQMATMLSGYTKTCVISFIDIYKKVERNFPEAREVFKKATWLFLASKGCHKTNDFRYSFCGI
ncbi:DUF1848 family protein [Butyrivibrio sp. INlla14]|uniref:DUF1848 family protein n=1 Tax=Butyrivibrio sp. INlla14 TaxID=1520808 RepID=UPI000876EEC1|nr:DUF1848 family protein [Butyrivibrio sp. INlla14]SCX95877.1 protein of unknown function [Butyrivibrio sp. INlla14]